MEIKTRKAVTIVLEAPAEVLEIPEQSEELEESEEGSES